MHQKQSLVISLQVVAGLLTLVGVFVLFAPAALALKLHATQLLEALLTFAAAFALLAIAALHRRENTAPPEVHASLARLQQQLMEMSGRLRDLPVMFERNTRSLPADAAPAKDYSEQLKRLAEAVADVREYSLLPDADRKQRLVAHRAEKRTLGIQELYNLVAAHEWSRAERLLITLQTDNPNDDDVAKGRSYLEHSRNLFADDAVAKAAIQIEEHMAAGAWDRALEQSRSLMQGFPGRREASTLLARVEREREAVRESTCQRLMDEIRTDIDRRDWRRALLHAERLIKQFPEHRHADKIGDQYDTLKENAEIQERQEMEVRIQELMRDGQFDNAIEVAEDLIRRYPQSPQADSLRAMLPRVREMAVAGPGDEEVTEGA